MSVLSLMVLIALSAVVIVAAKDLSHWNSTRARRLLLAGHAAKQTQMLEARLAARPDDVVRKWLSRYAQHFRDMEAKYRRGASRPWETLPPDPPEPDLPTFQELWESATAKKVDNEV